MTALTPVSHEARNGSPPEAINRGTFLSIHSMIKRVVYSFMLIIVSISGSFCGDLRSQNATLAKKDDLIKIQSPQVNLNTTTLDILVYMAMTVVVLFWCMHRSLRLSPQGHEESLIDKKPLSSPTASAVRGKGNILQDLATLDAVDGDSVPVDKTFALSKWESRKIGSNRDVVRREAYVANQEKKLQSKRRSKGRKFGPQLKPQGNVAEAIERFDSLVSAFSTGSTVTQDRYYTILGRIGALLTALTTCDNVNQVVAILFATLGQYFDAHSVRLMMKHLASSTTLQVQGVDKVKEQFTKYRSMLTSMEELPSYDVVSKGIMLMVFGGFKPSSLFCSDDYMGNLFMKFEKQCLKAISAFTIMEAVMSITEFVCVSIECWRTEVSLYSYMFPSTMHNRVTDILGWYQLYDEGRLEEMTGMTNEKYLFTIEKALVDLSNSISKKMSSHVYLSYDLYLTRLKNLKYYVKARNGDIKFRAAPFSVCVFSKTNTGKTITTELFIKMLEAIKGRRFKDEERAYIADFGKFDDTIKDNSLIYIFDDSSNAKTGNGDPKDTTMARFVNIHNNQPAPSTQAALESKGDIWYHPFLCCLNTNIPHLNAKDVSNHEGSIYRRIYFMELSVKEEFQDADGGLDPDKCKLNEDGIPVPAHNMQRYKWVKKGPSGYAMRYTDPAPMCITEMMPKVFAFMKEYFKKQDLFVKSIGKLKALESCSNCGMLKASGWCQCDAGEENLLEKESAEFLYQLANSGAYDACFAIANYVPKALCPIFSGIFEMKIAISTLQVIKGLIGITYFLADCLTPTQGFIFATIIWTTIWYGSYFMVWQLYVVFSVIGLIWFACFVVGIRLAVTQMLHRKINTAIKTGDCVPSALMAAATGVGGFFFFRTLTKLFFSKKLEEQGSLDPVSMQEVLERRAQVSDWVKPKPRSTLLDPRAKSATVEQMLAKLQNCLWRFYVSNERAAMRGSLLFIESNLCLIARHMWVNMVAKGTAACMFTVFKDPEDPTTSFNAHVVTSQQILDEEGTETDAVLIQFTQTPCMPSVTPLFFDGDVTKGMAKMVTRSEKGEILIREIFQDFAIKKIDGLESQLISVHNVSIPTTKGDCTSPIVCLSKPHCIVSLHCAGTGNRSASFVIKKEHILQALKKMESRMTLEGDEDDHAAPFAFGGNLNIAPYDHVYMQLVDKPDVRHPINYVENLANAGMDYHGYDVRSRISPKTRVHDTPMKAELAALGLPVAIGPPRFNANRDYGRKLQVRSHSMVSVNPELMLRAARDYVDPIFTKIQEIGYPQGGILTLTEALNGITGSRFITKIDETTSAGYGQKGAKSELLDITYSEIDGSKHFTPKTQLISEVNEIIAKGKAGIRSNPILKTTLKDEPVKYVDGEPKKKNRSFMNYPCADFLVCKMVFARVVEFVCSFPFLCESAAGINCTNDEWHQLGVWLRFFPNFMAGDYSDWDISISGQLIRMAGSVMITLCKWLGMNDDELRLAAVLIHEISSKHVLYHGALITFDGWGPSGTYVTLLLNGFCNAIVYRCSYFSQGLNTLYRDITMAPFRSVCRLITMGDDSVCAVASGVHFNMRLMSEWCRDHHLVYTDANKAEVINPYCDFAGVDFCKRRWRYEPRVFMDTAPLDINSILKSVCCYQESETDLRTVMVQNIDSACGELARHDYETFVRYQKLLLNAAENLDILPHLKYAHFTYEDWWERFKKRYYTPLDSSNDTSEKECFWKEFSSED